HSQNENLNRIVNWHNAQSRTLDVSVHFNAYQTTSSPMGTECLYVTQDSLAKKVADGIADVTGLPNRGPKYRGDLFFLNSTDEKSILVETVFVDSSKDASVYNDRFSNICSSLAGILAGKDIAPSPTPEPEPPDPDIPDFEPGRPTIGIGDQDVGDDDYVAQVQKILGIPVDGDFGPTTESAVKGYQAAYGEDVVVDGIV